MSALQNFFFGKHAKLSYVCIAAVILIGINLGAPTLWTQEHRWADICYAMMLHQDYLHPMLAGAPYYDKPLLSYWLVIIASKIVGFNTLALRLPSALAGVLAVWALYQSGKLLQNRTLGFIAAWMLLSTYYFLFWARVGNTDMLNLGGSLYAIYWYLAHRDRPSGAAMMIFFIIMAVTCLCKGLLGCILPMLFIVPDLIYQNRFLLYLRLKLILAVIPALILYLLPFLLSSYFRDPQYAENGLFEVFRENFVRYFNAFDHQDPVITYFQFLPLYIFPWILFFIPALVLNLVHWKRLNYSTRWIMISFLLIFIFFTASTSRRNYYTLSLVPFAVLLTADWIARTVKARRIAAWVMLIFTSVLFLFFVILKPLSFMGGGVEVFAKELKMQATQTAPWHEWQVVLLDARSSVGFYLQLPPDEKNAAVTGDRDAQTLTSLKTAWPELMHPSAHTIFISRMEYKPLLDKLLPGYRCLIAPLTLGERWQHVVDPSNPIAYVPVN